jgi:hypothetical protein
VVNEKDNVPFSYLYSSVEIVVGLPSFEREEILPIL